MTDFAFDNGYPNLSLDEVLVGAAVDSTNSTATSFFLKNPANGYTIEFIGSGFTYVNGIPTGGTIGEVDVSNAAGD